MDFVKGKDVFVALPTGFGCLPFLFDALKSVQNSIVIVVSPIIALMKDQVAAFLKGTS